ncbi:hypothetical protein H8L32_23785 [Undibacterium sp. CY18W]|uniref:Uncharacterized protein n=1 Tax=Undibacterium hunanense TaxID=2762292 RepID=A0ABR6ZXC5_9BURK|nr:hypothetical protein [Undibacterium hunanense]MBC3920506.1 hypothetical protein [Undibacterium hunanense]
MSRAFTSSLERLLNEFNSSTKGLLKKVCPEVDFSGISIYEAKENDEYHLMASFVGMRQMPKSAKKTENIFVVGKLLGGMAEKKPVLLKYNTEISFCRMKDMNNPTKNLTPMCGFHFDFHDNEKQFNHPIFHAQPKLKAGERFFSWKKEFALPEYPEQYNEIRTLRIPTAQMDIFSAVLMVIADHAIDPSDPDQHFQNFLKLVNRSLIPMDLKSAPPTFAEKMMAGNPFHALDWYPITATVQS